MIVDNAVYRDGSRLPHDLGPEDIPGANRLCEAGDFQWVGLHDPTTEELDLVSSVFGLHHLAVEDALKAHQRPKLEHYDDMLFLVVKTLWYVEEEDAVETGEINVFAGPGYVVTVRHGAGTDLIGSRRSLELHPELMTLGPPAVLYAVCDRVVDDYEAVGAALEIDVDEVELSVFSEGRTRDAARIYVLKRELSEVRRAVLPLREPMRRFAAGDVPGVADRSAPYFRDVADHLQRVSEVVDTLDSLLSYAFDAHVAQISMQQNDDMRRISAGAALVVVPTLIAGVYGMNFDHMPELEWTFGYAYALVLMTVTAAGLYVLFKRAGWL